MRRRSDRLSMTHFSVVISACCYDFEREFWWTHSFWSFSIKDIVSSIIRCRCHEFFCLCFVLSASESSCGYDICSSARAPLILICAMWLKDYSIKDYSFAPNGEYNAITTKKEKRNDCVNRNLSTDPFPSG